VGGIPVPTVGGILSARYGIGRYDGFEAAEIILALPLTVWLFPIVLDKKSDKTKQNFWKVQHRYRMIDYRLNSALRLVPVLKAVIAIAFMPFYRQILWLNGRVWQT